MKKIVAFVLSASMCLSLLTVLNPAFAAEENGTEQTIQMRAVGPEEDDLADEPLRGQRENN